MRNEVLIKRICVLKCRKLLPDKNSNGKCKKNVFLPIDIFFTIFSKNVSKIYFTANVFSSFLKQNDDTSAHEKEFWKKLVVTFLYSSYGVLGFAPLSHILDFLRQILCELEILTPDSYSAYQTTFKNVCTTFYFEKKLKLFGLRWHFIRNMTRISVHFNKLIKILRSLSEFVVLNQILSEKKIQIKRTFGCWDLKASLSSGMNPNFCVLDQVFASVKRARKHFQDLFVPDT